MGCSRCGHPYESHRLGKELKCRVRIGYGWDTKTQQFASTAPCLCPGYVGIPPGGEKCPHEYVRWQPACVHCGHEVAKEKKAT